MSDDNLEAENPFNQAKLQDSLNFESNFWKDDKPTNPKNPFNQSAYDNVDDHDKQYSKMNDGNAYDDNQPKKNPIKSLISNIKSKLNDNDNNNNNDDIYNQTNNDVNDNYAPPDPQPAKKKSKKKPPKNNITTLNQSQITLTHDELDKKEEYLDRREKQLIERKKRLEAVRSELNNSNIRRDNWPCTYYPITFHSIQQEIPPHARSHMKRMYTLVLLTFLIFILNAFAILVLYFPSVASEGDLLLAILYLFAGVCGSWRLWYRQIYYGLRDRKTLKMWCFFIFFGIHICFCILMCLGISSLGGAGIIIMVDAFSDGKSSFGGFCALICACLWGIVALGSIFYLKKSWVLYKQRGGIEQARGDVAAIVAQHAAEQLV